MKILSENKKGFTLVELILYVALVSLFVGGAIKLAWNISYGGAKALAQQEVNQNLRFTAAKISYEIKNAKDVISIGADNICLEMWDSSRNPTKIYRSSQEIRMGWGGESSDCTGLTNDENLTGNKVIVTNFSFVDLSVANLSQNISFSLEIEGNNPDGRQEWDKVQQYSTSVEVRSR